MHEIKLRGEVVSTDGKHKWSQLQQHGEEQCGSTAYRAL